MSKLSFFGPKTEYTALLSHIPVYCASLPFPMSIRAIATVCQLPILFFSGESDVLPGLLGSQIYDQDTITKRHSVQNLTRKDAGKTFISVQGIVFKIMSCTRLV